MEEAGLSLAFSSDAPVVREVSPVQGALAASLPLTGRGLPLMRSLFYYTRPEASGLEGIHLPQVQEVREKLADLPDVHVGVVKPREDSLSSSRPWLKARHPPFPHPEAPVGTVAPPGIRDVHLPGDPPHQPTSGLRQTTKTP